MKFLDLPEFDHIVEALSQPLSGVKLDVKLEAYSCKMVAADKKMFKELSANMPEKPRLSGPQMTSSTELGSSPSFLSGDLGEVSEGATQPEISVKTLSYLIGALNQAFPDHDFVDVSPSSFCREVGFQNIQHHIDDYFQHFVKDYADFRQLMWNVMDQEIDIRNCDLYSFDYKTDEYFRNSLWNVNVFFFNKSLQRLVFFSAIFSTDTQKYDDNRVDGISDDCEEYGFLPDP